MSTYELGRRLGVTASRVRQLELAELQGSIKLSVLDRTARALNCDLVYVLVPRESLEQMVKRQARQQAEKKLASSVSREGGGADVDDPALMVARLEVLANQLVVRRGLWTEHPHRRRGSHPD
jgi:predicted DNA-binding mobile mystery protein A